MGSFSRTCSITNLAIGPYDPVFYILFREAKGYPGELYDKMQEIHRYQSRKADCEERLAEKDASRIMRAYYETELFRLENPIEKQGFSEYDDYGGVEDEYVSKQEHTERLLLIHKEAYEEFCGGFPDESLQGALEILRMMYSLRKPMILTSLLGRQYFDLHEAFEKEQLMSITVKILKKNIEEQDQDGEYKGFNQNQ